MNEPEDDDERRLFANLRDADSRGVPAFEGVMRGARQRQARRATTRRGLALAGLAVVCLLVGLRYGREEAGATGGSTPPSISTWRAPSDSLLPASGKS